ncbi:MAG: hypothetical protein F6K55_28330 [Moorea sp. SIO4A3]|nr:hypothetical protein [Moorena sp. SIO4A3]
MRYTLFFTSSLFPAPCSRLDAKREWGKPRQLLMVCSRSPLAWPTAKRRLRRSYRKIVEPY